MLLHACLAPKARDVDIHIIITDSLDTTQKQNEYSAAENTDPSNAVQRQGGRGGAGRGGAGRSGAGRFKFKRAIRDCPARDKQSRGSNGRGRMLAVIGRAQRTCHCQH